MNYKEELDQDIIDLEKEVFGTQDDMEVEENIIPTDTEIVPAPAPVQVEDWEKRYKGYRASTDITIRDLRSDLAKSKTKYATLQIENSDLRKALNEKASSTPINLFSEEDTDIVGETAASAINRGVANLIDSKVKPLQEEVERGRKLLAEKDLEDAKKTAKSVYDQPSNNNYSCCILKVRI